LERRCLVGLEELHGDEDDVGDAEMAGIITHLHADSIVASPPSTLSPD
jgi:hypothetical protein